MWELIKAKSACECEWVCWHYIVLLSVSVARQDLSSSGLIAFIWHVSGLIVQVGCSKHKLYI